jgi:hypothetical protein
MLVIVHALRWNFAGDYPAEQARHAGEYSARAE